MKKINDIVTYCDYEVKIEINGTAYCGCDCEGDGKYENYSNIETKTINGGKLLELIAMQLNKSDIASFCNIGNKYFFSFFEPNDGSSSSVAYTILKEKLN